MAIAQDDQAQRPAVTGGGHAGDHHRPLFFMAVPAHADQQRGIGRQAALGEQAGAQFCITIGRGEHAWVHPQRIVDHMYQPTIAQPFRQAGRRRNHLIITGVEPAQIAPEPIEAAIDRLARQESIEIAINPGRQRLGVHEQAARRGARPIGHGRRTAPWRGALDEIRLQFIQRIVDDPITGEIEIVAIQREARALDVDQPRLAHFAHAVVGARHHHGQPHTVLFRHFQLAVGIGADAATLRGIKRRDVDEMHG